MKFCTHIAYIFVGSYTKFEVDGSVRYRDIAINVGESGAGSPPLSLAGVISKLMKRESKFLLV